jgi:hypothetical protein
LALHNAKEHATDSERDDETNKTGGVAALGKRWAARIYYGAKRHCLGTFTTKQEAALAYDGAAREHGGGKKKLNFESIKAAEETAAHAQAEIFADALCAGPCIYRQIDR